MDDGQAIPWGELRRALRLTQTAFARALGVSREGYRKIERATARRPHATTVRSLRQYLARAENARLIEAAGLVNPFGDVQPTMAAPRWCAVCDGAMKGHARCPSCGGLIGPGHPVDHDAATCPCGASLRRAS